MDDLSHLLISCRELSEFSRRSLKKSRRKELTNYSYFARHIRKHIRASFCDHDIIFNTHAITVWQINPRFYGECHSRFQQLQIIAAHVRFFMSFHPNAMSGAVRKVHTVTSFLDDFARSMIYIRTRYTSLPRSAPRRIGFLHDLMDFLIFLVHL